MNDETHPEVPNAPFRLFQTHGASLIVFFVLVLLTSTIFAWYYTRQSIAQKTAMKFQKEVEEIQLLIQDRMDLYIQTLYGVQALFAASQKVERDEWSSYIQTHRLHKRYPGITMFRFIERVPAAQKNLFIESVRSDTSLLVEGYPSFDIYPKKEREEYFVIKYIEPMAGNEPLLGLDVSVSGLRLLALKEAARTGEPMATRRMDLVSQGVGRPEEGFLIALPVYRNEAPILTSAQRQEALAGFVEAVFEIEDLLSGIFGEESVHPEIGFEVYDGETLSFENLFYRDALLKDLPPDFDPRFESKIILEVAGKPWILHFVALPGFGLEETQRKLPWVILIGGVMFSFLVFAALYSLATARSQAIGMAEQMTKQLRESEHRYADLVEGAPDPILILDRLGHLRSMNPAAEKVSGYQAGELLGKYFATMNVVSTASLAKSLEEFAFAIVGRQRPPFELEILRKDGKVLTLEANPRPIKEGGKTTAVQVIFRDVTERKHIEETIRRLNEDLKRRNIELSAANSDLEAFGYSVSHDLRAPLRAISGFSKALLEDYSDKLDDQGKKYLGLIDSGAAGMSRLIDDLLTFARLGRKEIDLSEIRMTELAEEVFRELSQVVVGREIEFRVKHLQTAKGDLAMIRQVLINLISNAIKFTSKNPDALIEMGSRPHGDEIIYFIKDNGVGFDSRYASKLFSVFQRLHTAQEFEGTGVGLAIVKRIIHRHGGRIWAESRIGEGATFYFTLPLTIHG
jgi:PAS domain S-box-containing protein